MIELLEGMKIKNQISVKNKDFEFEKFSVFDDIYDGHEKRTNIRSLIYDNLRDREWRRNLMHSPLLSSSEQKVNDETYGIIPHLKLKETVELVEQTYNFLNRTQSMIYGILVENINQLKEINVIRNRVPSLSQIEDAVNQEKKILGFWDRRQMEKNLRNFKVEMKNIGKDQTKMVKETQLATDAYGNIIAILSSNSFLTNFVEFFHEKLPNGNMRFKKQKRWKNLFNDFLKFQFPHTFSLFNGKGIDGGNPFSLTGSSWNSNKDAQKSLITLLQSFGQIKRINIVTTFDEKFDVQRMDCEHIADTHLVALSELTLSDMSDQNE